MHVRLLTLYIVEGYPKEMQINYLRYHAFAQVPCWQFGDSSLGFGGLERSLCRLSYNKAANPGLTGCSRDSSSVQLVVRAVVPSILQNSPLMRMLWEGCSYQLELSLSRRWYTPCMNTTRYCISPTLLSLCLPRSAAAAFGEGLTRGPCSPS